MRKLRVLILVHSQLVPPPDLDPKTIDRFKTPYITEYDVMNYLKKVGHQVEVVGVYSDLRVIRDKVEEFRPHIVFNLLEEFDGETLFDQNVVSYLELLRVPYTGCNPRGLILARDKALSKKILSYHRIKSPKFHVFPKSRKPKISGKMKYPMIVKCLSEEASLGISNASIVSSDEKLLERVKYIHKKFGVDAIAEQFIEGREFYVGVYGNHQIKTLPVWELSIDESQNPEKEIYTVRAKFSASYRKEKGIRTDRAKIDEKLERKIVDVCRKTYKALGLNGYARIDLRIDSNENIYIIEANPNPDISFDDEFAESAKYEKIKYPDLLEKILRMGISWFGGFPETP